jgi:K+-transporting ATPase ATPase C chain
MKYLRPAVVMIALFTILTGFILPLAFVGIGKLAFPTQAGGSLVSVNGKIVGSTLIAQGFTLPKYFWPRPSAASYAGDNSSGSNLAPTSAMLIKRVTGDVAKYGGSNVPADAVTTSGSGLDPDISPAFAALQVSRVAKARGMDPAKLAGLVAQHTEGRWLGIFGEPTVNVLELNLALDQS